MPGGAAAAALVLVGVLATIAVHERLAVTRRTRLAQQLGHEVERHAARLRLAYLAPLHDIRDVRRSVEEYLASLADRQGRLGVVERGAILYARGRGQLELGRLEQARALLSEAIDAGYRSPELSQAMGLTYAGLYQDELLAIASVSDPVLRRTRTERIERELLEPAAEHLADSRDGGLADSEYLEAMLAFCDMRYDDALRLARAAHDRDPALYQPLLLQAQIHRLRANIAADGGDFAAARETFGRSARAFEQAIRVGESDPASYLGLGLSISDQVDMEIHDAGGEVVPLLDRARSAFEQGLRADPDHVRLLGSLSNLHRLHGELLLEQGEDPAEALGLAREAAARATTLDPGYAAGWMALGNLGIRSAEHLALRGEDPRPSLIAAISSLERSVELELLSARAAGGYEARCRAAQRAVDAFRQAVAENPLLTAECAPLLDEAVNQGKRPDVWSGSQP